MFNTAKLVAGELVPMSIPQYPVSDDYEVFEEEDGTKHIAPRILSVDEWESSEDPRDTWDYSYPAY